MCLASSCVLMDVQPSETAMFTISIFSILTRKWYATCEGTSINPQTFILLSHWDCTDSSLYFSLFVRWTACTVKDSTQTDLLRCIFSGNKNDKGEGCGIPKGGGDYEIRDMMLFKILLPIMFIYIYDFFFINVEIKYVADCRKKYLIGIEQHIQIES